MGGGQTQIRFVFLGEDRLLVSSSVLYLSEVRLNTLQPADGAANMQVSLGSCDVIAVRHYTWENV